MHLRGVLTPKVLPVLVPIHGEDTWLMTVGVLADSVSLSIHRPRLHFPPLSHIHEWRATDDVGTRYLYVGGFAGLDPPEQEEAQVDFSPAPPPEAAILRVWGVSSDLAVAISLVSPRPACPSPELLSAYRAAANAPRRIIATAAVIDPDGCHPVSVFAVELWTRETVIWAAWKSARGSQYVMSAGGFQHPMGHTVHGSQPGVSVARIRLPLVVANGDDHLDVRVRLRGTPGVDGAARLDLGTTHGRRNK